MKRFLLLTGLLSALATSCKKDELSLVQSESRTETFQQLAAPKVDVLWVVDNSRSMAAEQEKIATEAAHFLLRLETMGLDYHIGVITTDPSSNGRLRAYSGATTGTCSTCRFVSSATGCAAAEALLTEAEAGTLTTATLGDRCPSLSVFQQFIRAGTAGSTLERGFKQAAMALGLDVSSGVRGQVPPQNNDFLRPEADLMLLFVSDEDEGLGAHDAPVHYFERLFGSLKRGNQQVSISTITGWPLAEQQAELDLDYNIDVDRDICSTLGPMLRGDKPADPARARDMSETFKDRHGCLDLVRPADTESRADLGARYIRLACRMGGQVVNICRRNFREGLSRLADSIVRLTVSFPLLHAAQLDWGDDCAPFTEDDGALDCDGNGVVTDAIDGPLCITAQSDDGPPALVPRDENGWQWDAVTGAITFLGDFVPQTGSSIEVVELLRPAGQRCFRR